MNKSTVYHIPVMLNECIQAMQLKDGETYVDVTFGGGGHTQAILDNAGAGSRIYSFDQDSDALENSINDDRLTLIHSNFRYLENYLKLYKALPVDAILADLGVSSHQFDKADRGFSTRFDAKLDLRMDQNAPKSAADLVNTYSTEELNDIFKQYGELKNAFKISKTIVEQRSHQEIKTTGQLMKAIERFAPRGKENRFYAQVFQALRIEVNEELTALKEMLEQTASVLKPGGRLVVISYHSLEDRLVKNFIRSGNFKGVIEQDFYGNVIAPLKAVNRKPITPGEEEIAHNSRARSAKLRVAVKL